MGPWCVVLFERYQNPILPYMNHWFHSPFVDRLSFTDERFKPRDAIQALGSAKVPEFPGPYRFAVTFQDAAQAANAALFPGAELNGATVQVRSNDFEEGYRHSVRLIGLGSAVARNEATQAVLRTQPSVRLAVTDQSSARWLDPSIAAPEPPGRNQRYWGAR